MRMVYGFLQIYLLVIMKNFFKLVLTQNNIKTGYFLKTLCISNYDRMKFGLYYLTVGKKHYFFYRWKPVFTFVDIFLVLLLRM